MARRFPEIAYPTSLVEGQHTLTSYAERLVLRWLLTLSGIHEPIVHPKLCGSNLYADFLITAVTGRSVYVEVVGMLESAESTGRDGHCAGYHARLLGKIETYRALGLDLPVLIFVEDLTPWGLETKRAEILARLGLPSCSPSPSVWIEL